MDCSDDMVSDGLTFKQRARREAEEEPEKLSASPRRISHNKRSGGGSWSSLLPTTDRQQMKSEISTLNVRRKGKGNHLDLITPQVEIKAKSLFNN